MTSEFDDFEEELLQRHMSMDGHLLQGHVGSVDLDGKPVKKTKLTNPYNYDGFVLHRLGPNKNINGCVYTDRMQQWDYDKYGRLCKKHLPGKRWDNAEPSAIAAFLREYHADRSIRLIVVMEWCNQATGYPTWSLHFKSDLSKV